MSCKPRTRFDLWVVFADGTYVNFRSPTRRPITPAFFVAKLREYADLIEEVLAVFDARSRECAGADRQDRPQSEGRVQ